MIDPLVTGLSEKLLSDGWVTALATIVIAGLTIGIVLFARRQLHNQALFYLHQYLADPHFGKARLAVRSELMSKPYDCWSAEDRCSANAVAASYDQAAILLNSGCLPRKYRKQLVASSWGQSICDQREILSVYLLDRQTPTQSGAQFFSNFLSLYAEAAEQRPLLLVISGGQTGVDQGALEAAVDAGIPYGGWCPKGGATEKVGEDVTKSFSRLLATQEDDPSVRTALNIMWATHTLVLYDRSAEFADGTQLAIDICKRWGKPFIVTSLHAPDLGAQVDKLIGKDCRNRILLNIAGPRESNAPGIQEKTKRVLGPILDELKNSFPRYKRAVWERPNWEQQC